MAGKGAGGSAADQQAEVGEEHVTEKSRESRLRREIADLKRLLAGKALEVDFFKGALQKVEVQRRWGNGAGEQAFYGHIRCVMSLQGGLGIEQLCMLGGCPSPIC